MVIGKFFAFHGQIEETGGLHKALQAFAPRVPKPGPRRDSSANTPANGIGGKLPTRREEKLESPRLSSFSQVIAGRANRRLVGKEGEKEKTRSLAKKDAQPRGRNALFKCMFRGGDNKTLSAYLQRKLLTRSPIKITQVSAAATEIRRISQEGLPRVSSSTRSRIGSFCRGQGAKRNGPSMSEVAFKTYMGRGLALPELAAASTTKGSADGKKKL